MNAQPHKQTFIISMCWFHLKTEEQYIVSMAIQNPARIEKQQETLNVADLFFVLTASLSLSITREP